MPGNSGSTVPVGREMAGSDAGCRRRNG